MKPLPVYTPPPLVDSCRLAASVLDAVLTQKLPRVTGEWIAGCPPAQQTDVSARSPDRAAQR